MKTFKKIAKIVAILIAIAAAVAGVYYAIKKIQEKKNAEAAGEDNYVTCSCAERPENL